MSCARPSRRRTRCYHAGSDLAGGLVGPNWLDVAAWVPAARAFIEGHFTLTMEVQAMIHIMTCVVAAAALWRSGPTDVQHGADEEQPVEQAESAAGEVRLLPLHAHHANSGYNAIDTGGGYGRAAIRAKR